MFGMFGRKVVVLAVVKWGNIRSRVKSKPEMT